jgi:hypothetical protein
MNVFEELTQYEEVAGEWLDLLNGPEPKVHVRPPSSTRHLGRGNHVESEYIVFVAKRPANIPGSAAELHDFQPILVQGVLHEPPGQLDATWLGLVELDRSAIGQVIRKLFIPRARP